MGNERVMGFLHTYPAYQVGNRKNIWDLREYGLSEVWVKRESTVPNEHEYTVGHPIGSVAR